MKARTRIPAQILILTLATIVIVLMIQLAQAEENSSNKDINQNLLLAQNNNQGQILQGLNYQNSKTDPQFIQIEIPKKSFASKIIEKTTLSYYQQFLGPTMSGPNDQTYNVFQEGINNPRTGHAPLQSFHSIGLRYQINQDWAIGASLAAVNGYTKQVENKGPKGTVVNTPDSFFFNTRINLNLPSFQTSIGTLFSTFSYEIPTSVISRNDDMAWGWVLAESFNFKLPSHKWSAGITGQYYRTYFNHRYNKKPAPFVGGYPIPLQTVIVSIGPFANYRINDQWQLNSSIIIDWDQVGGQTDTTSFNNNLPHRGRAGISYFPNLKFLSSIGFFAQGPLKFRPDTTALGADISLRF